MQFLYYRVIALISVNIVLSWDIEGRELAISRILYCSLFFRKNECDVAFVVQYRNLYKKY